MREVMLELAALKYTSPLATIAEQSSKIAVFVMVYVHGFMTYIVSHANGQPDHAERYTTLLGTQLEFHNLVYAVDPGVPSPKSAYLMFSLVGF